MTAADLVAVGVALVGTLALGTAAHELSHAVALRALGVPYAIHWLPDRGSGGPFDAGIRGTWAAVSPRALPSEVSPLGLRLAAISPLSLAAPLPLVLAGVLPDPVASGNAVLVAATVAWFACALPSPQDFSVFWHAERAMAEYASPTPGERPADDRRG